MSETVTVHPESTLPPRTIVMPEMSLVVMIGASGCGKSTFARTHFKPFETLSSDFCRGLVSNDENSQSATTAAFDVLRYIAAKRLEAGLLTVVDATNVQPEARKPLIELARRYHDDDLGVLEVLTADHERGGDVSLCGTEGQRALDVAG